VKVKHAIVLLGATLLASLGLLLVSTSLLQVLEVYSPSQVTVELLGRPEGLVTSSPIRFLWMQFTIPVNRGLVAAAFSHPFFAYGLLMVIVGIAAGALFAVGLMRERTAAPESENPSVAASDA